jgi:hypothetical protein
MALNWQRWPARATVATTSTSTPPATIPHHRAALAPCWVESFHGVLWECACGEADISRILESARFEAITTDLVDRGFGRGGNDFLTFHATYADHIVTNPPYSPPPGLAARFVERALTRIRPGGTVCMLLPINWEAAQSHRHLMARCCRKHAFSPRHAMHRGGCTGKKSAMDSSSPGGAGAAWRTAAVDRSRRGADRWWRKDATRDVGHSRDNGTARP